MDYASIKDAATFATDLMACSINAAIDEITKDGSSRVFMGHNDEYSYVVVPENYDVEKDEDNLLANLSDPFNFPSESGIDNQTINAIVNSCAVVVNEFQENYPRTLDNFKMKNKGEELGAKIGSIIANQLLGNTTFPTSKVDMEIICTVNDYVAPGNLDFNPETKAFMISYSNNQQTMRMGMV